MSDKVLKNKTPVLENLTTIPAVEAPKEIKIDEVKLQRVARPLRHVKNIPVKAQVFHSAKGPISFSYENKINLPISKNKLVVEVKYVGLNPVDLKIKNGYTNAIYGEVGLGREYSGVVVNVGENLTDKWNEGDEVFGIYFHPHLAKGCLQTAILVDPSEDPILLRPDNVDPKEAAGALFVLGTAFNILDRLDKRGYLKQDSNVLINGGTSSVGMCAIQLLKRYYQLTKKIVVVTTGSSADALRDFYPDLDGELIYINYLKCRGKSSKPLRTMIEEQKTAVVEPTTGNEIEIQYLQGKFDIVLDFIGGYDIVAHSSYLIHKNGAYLTTVGDYVANYKTDIYNQWDNPRANMRKMFGSVLYSYDYTHFYFDPNAKTAAKNDWINRCGEFLKTGVVTCRIDKIYNWNDIDEAFSYMKTQRAQGKLILKVEKF